MLGRWKLRFLFIFRILECVFIFNRKNRVGVKNYILNKYGQYFSFRFLRCFWRNFYFEWIIWFLSDDCFGCGRSLRVFGIELCLFKEDFVVGQLVSWIFLEFIVMDSRFIIMIRNFQVFFFEIQNIILLILIIR